MVKRTAKKILSGQPTTPPPHSELSTKKNNFFAASLSLRLTEVSSLMILRTCLVLILGQYLAFMRTIRRFYLPQIIFLVRCVAHKSVRMYPHCHLSVPKMLHKKTKFICLAKHI